MYLKKLIIINYKSCQYLELNPFKAEPTVLIGINDCGKTTILKAIGLLLDEKPLYNAQEEGNMKNDLSHERIPGEVVKENLSALSLPMLPDAEGEVDKTYVVGELGVEAADLEKISDSDYSNHLLWTLDYQNDPPEKSLWLCRSFHTESLRGEYFLLTPDSTRRDAFFGQKKAILIKAQKELGISDEVVENENRKGPYRNIERVRALYLHGDLDVEWYWTPYNIKKDRSLFPVFSYMDWNVSMGDLEKHANEILHGEIEEYLEESKKVAAQQADKAQGIVNEKLKAISDEITADIPEIEGLEANIHFETNSKITDFLVKKKYSAEPVHIDNQGDGVRRQLWFGLMRWKAKSPGQEEGRGKQFIWCFDEPETHLYPRAQREFFGLIKKIAEKNIQVLLSTHSSIFVDRARLRSIHQVYLEEGLTRFSNCDTAEDVYQALQIRNSDFLFFDRFLMVEGDTEAVLIPHLYRLHSGRNLYDDGIQLVKLGGSGKREQNLKVLKNLLHDYQKVEGRTVYILDKDVSFKPEKIDSSNAYYVGKQDIEDSICSSVWSRFYSDHLPEGISLSREEVESIKEGITDQEAISSKDKFFRVLSKAAVKKIQEADASEEVKDDYLKNLPSDKGTNISEKLCAYINSLDQVDPNIQAAFTKLQEE